ncbi:MAG: hypothetical protein HQL06_00410 [Nitrospirae bacterium]|nr:hypothetical protein [Nitrospirota bacterium]
MELDTKDRMFLNRLIKRKKYFLTFSILSTMMGIGMLIYHFVSKDSNSLRLVLVVFILLSGRANLRQYKISVLLDKIKLLD